ncbi:nitrate- and nitrite sensing domain-containing protein [Plantactinospora sp. B24E8]|uniref:sensor histidine kinase n=1 Tax=Plantactinospora sp. B24E8 TaxID=3153567 RepID=UPI00325E5DE5
METQNWPIRSKIVALVAVPIAALMALWIFATTLTVGPATSLLAARTLLDEVGRPAEALVLELQRERRLSVMQLADPAVAPALTDQRARTDHAIDTLRRHASNEDVRDTTSQALDARLDQLLTALGTLSSGRSFIDGRSVDATGALGLYSGIIDAAFRTFTALQALPDESLNREVAALTALGRAREVLAQADALLAGVFRVGRFGPGEHSQLVQIIGTQRFLYAAAIAELPDADRTEYQRLTEAEPFARLRALEDDLIGRGRGGAAPPVDAQAWQSTYETVQQQLREFELDGAEALTERSRPVAVNILVRLGLAGLLGLVAVLASGFIALRIGRSLVRRLTSLRAAALTMADERLPDVVGRLRKGEVVDVAVEAPPLDYGRDEIGQLGQAFSEVQRTAISSAVDEAALRKSLRDVFLNIARRSQTLLHRQLALLDRMERRVTEPTELADLFRLDHMATRMRRHAEDLVILAGAPAGRGWRNPVTMVDVIRGAISEVEDYARVELGKVAPSAVTGPAVGDVIHLLAELIENATSFSPPHTRVRVTGQPGTRGYTVEIEDQGLGMSAEAIEDANRRLAEPPEFDPANSARLGLFVVARLGARHGVRVRLQPSPYGGITAVVLVPSDLVVSESAVPTPRDGRTGAQPAPDGVEVASRPGGDQPGGPAADRAPKSGPALTAESPAAPAVAPEPDPRPASALGPRRKAGAALDALIASAPAGRFGELRSGTDQVPVGEQADPAVPPRPTESSTPSAGGTTGAVRDAGSGPAPAGTASAAVKEGGTTDRQRSPDGGPAGDDDTVVMPALRQQRPAGGPAGDDDTVVMPALRADGPVRAPVAPAGADGLPRRIRQTSLAPQLRTGGPAPAGAGRSRPGGGVGGTTGAADGSDEPAPRSPEQVRAVMAALQSGTARGRRDSGATPPSIGNPDVTARVADPGATDSERDG